MNCHTVAHAHTVQRELLAQRHTRHQPCVLREARGTARGAAWRAAAAQHGARGCGCPRLPARRADPAVPPVLQRPRNRPGTCCWWRPLHAHTHTHTATPVANCQSAENPQQTTNDKRHQHTIKLTTTTTRWAGRRRVRGSESRNRTSCTSKCSSQRYRSNRSSCSSWGSALRRRRGGGGHGVGCPWRSRAAAPPLPAGAAVAARVACCSGAGPQGAASGARPPT